MTERYATIRQDLTKRVVGHVAHGIDPDWATRVLLAAMDGLQIQWLLNQDVDMPLIWNAWSPCWSRPLQGPSRTVRAAGQADDRQVQGEGCRQGHRCQ
ncbi:hypothetical protein AB0D59_15550 [Streptomyces sp. NPDC048417]|uniref:hypothetical protein n=1 Tax=Streptomyces sp. NPDC048417 TaxID=3155387 RepID=UPI0034242702